MGAELRGRCRPDLYRPGPVDFPYRLPNHYFSILVRVYEGYRGDGKVEKECTGDLFFRRVNRCGKLLQRKGCL